MHWPTLLCQRRLIRSRADIEVRRDARAPLLARGAALKRCRGDARGGAQREWRSRAHVDLGVVVENVRGGAGEAKGVGLLELLLAHILS